MSIDQLIDLADRLDQAGLQKEADSLDLYIEKIIKEAKPGMHKCGLKEESVQHHLELLKGYEKALEHYNSEYKKALQSRNEKDSPNYGKLREITSNYAHNYNAVYLHGIYINDVINNNPYPLSKESQMQELLKQYYDSDEAKFSSELKRLALIPRNGWVLFSFDVGEKKLIFNVIDLQDEHLISCCVPILALDMWEHAYFNDFQLDKEAYVDWFLSRIDWRNPRKRLRNLLRLK